MKNKIKKYEFFKTKYGDELLIDLIPLEKLEKYIKEGCPHYLTYYDITLIGHGKGILSIDNQHCKLVPGKIIFSSPGQIRNWNVRGIPEGFVLLFEEEFLRLFMNDNRFIEELRYFNAADSPCEFVLKKDEKAYLTNLFHTIQDEIQHFKNTDKHILRALLYQVLVWIDRKYANRYPMIKALTYPVSVRTFIDLVNRNFMHHHLVGYYAEQLNITPGHLSDLCNKYLSLSAKQTIQNKIITEAKKLLIYSDKTVAEISYSLNFEDPSYFVRMFRNMTGYTPLAFRKSNNP